MSEEGYVCTLNEESVEVARKELFEVPSDRLSSVKALRDWINSQTYLKFPTDTRTLLRYLRGAKFSQIRARELVKSTLKLKNTAPEWMLNIDTHAPGIQELLKAGYIIPLPKLDSHYRQILLLRFGCPDPKSKVCGLDDEMKMIQVMHYYNNSNEYSQVNGLVVIIDYTGYTAKHMSRWSIDTVRKAIRNWQDAMPGRLKRFHFYNAGGFFDTVLSLIKPFMKTKFVDRNKSDFVLMNGVKMQTHSTLESLYKHIPMDLLPDDYLPDDYDGPSAGSLETLNANLRNAVMEPDFRQGILDISSDKYFIDLSKKTQQDAPAEAFRKLNVD